MNETRRPTKKKQARSANEEASASQAPPKRYKSSYLCFAVTHQDEVKAELGKDSRLGDVSKRMAEKWKALSSEEKKKYDDAAKDDRARYEEEMASYTGPLKARRRSHKKDPSAPKRPMSAFLFFSQKYRPTITAECRDMNSKDICKRLGEMWRAASEDERNVYVREEERQRAKYKIDMGKWKKQHAEEKAKAKKEKKKARAQSKAQEKKKEKEERTEEEELMKSNLPGGLTEANNDGQDYYASINERLYAGGAQEGAYGSYFGASSGQGSQYFHEGGVRSAQGLARRDPLYAYMHSRYPSTAGLGIMDMVLRSPYWEGSSRSPSGVGVRGAGTFGLRGLEQEAYLQGLRGYGGLTSIEASLQGVNMGGALQGSDTGAPPFYGYDPYGSYGHLAYPASAAELMERRMSRNADAARGKNERSGSGESTFE